MNPEKSSMSATSYSRSNHLSLLHRGAEFFPALIHAIDAANVEIYLETYIFAVDDTANQVRDALMRAASRGVMVYVLVDWLGTGRSNVALLQSKFEPSGVHFVAFNPWFQRGIARTHRKIVQHRAGILQSVSSGRWWMTSRRKSPRNGSDSPRKRCVADWANYANYASGMHHVTVCSGR